MTQYFLVLKAFQPQRCMRDVFSNKWIEKSYMQFFGVWFLKLKQQDTLVNYNKD